MSLSEEDRLELFYGFWAVLTELHDVKEELRKLQRREAMDAATIQQKLADQQEQIAANTDVVAGSSALMDELAQMIRDSVGNEAALQAIADSIDSNNTTLSTNNQTLAEAIARNTPAEPAA